MKFIVFRPDGTVSGPLPDADGHEGTIIEVADDFDWLLWIADLTAHSLTPSLTHLRDRKWGWIKAERELRRMVIATDFGPFDADETAKTNLLGKLKSFDLLPAEQLPSTVVWKLHDNSFAQLARADFIAACLQVLAGIEAIYETSFQLEAAIAAADTAEAIEAIAWPAA